MEGVFLMKKVKVSLICLSVLAIALEILPFGAVLNFANDGATIRKTFSFFSLTPFGYANFAPFITALLSCVLLFFSIIYLVKDSNSAGNAIMAVSALASLLSLAPILYGFDYFSVLGGCISVVLLGCFGLSMYAKTAGKKE